MKRLLFVLLSALAIATGSSAASGIANYPIVQRPDTLRILGIGNSFTDDGMMYLPNLLASAGIHNVVLGRLYIGGCTLERHVHEYEGQTQAYVYYKSTHNRWVTVSKTASLLDGLRDEKWDIVVLQQASGYSGLYSSYEPWLDQLMEIVRFNCRNAGACIAWQQTWAYATTSTHPDFPKYYNNQLLMYQNIMSCNETLVDSSPIQVVIPTGTAIQNLRTAQQDARDYTRDGYHLNYKMGRYTAACTWFQALVAPAFGTSVEGNGCRLAGSSQHLSDDEALRCQLAVRQACARRFEVWK